MKVFIGAPVRNRGWVLERHLKSLLSQEIEKEFCYIVNDCTDSTEKILKNLDIPYKITNLKTKNGWVRGEYSIKNLAFLRNQLLQEFLSGDCDYLFSVDSDVIIPANSICQLIEDDKDIISMLIKNHPNMKAHNIMRNRKHISDVPEGIIPVDITGAVYLIKRKVIESGVKYKDFPQGEDIPFCKEAKTKGFNIYCDSRLKPIHAYREGLDLVAETV